MLGIIILLKALKLFNVLPRLHDENILYTYILNNNVMRPMCGMCKQHVRARRLMTQKKMFA